MGLSWLSSTESKLKLRTIGRAGMGRYIVRSTVLYLSAEGGLGGTGNNYMAPNDTTPADPRISEFVGYVAGVFDIFDLGDFEFYFSTNYYINIGKRDRHRVDLNTELTYDLPLDFYIRLGFVLNFDSRPSTGADNNDYQFTSGVGWSF